MANIYQLNGKSVYDYNGQTIDAQTGQPVSNARTTQSLGITPPAAQTPTQNNVSGSVLPNTNLQPGATGASVKQLQDYLVSKGYMTQAQVNTGYGTYGPQTTAAVAAMQKALGVDNSSGVGYYGPKTISAAQSTQSSTPVQTGGNNGVSTAAVPAATPVPAGAADNVGPSGAITVSPTGDPQLDQVLKAIAGVGNNIIKSGYTIPAGLQITPDLVSQFLNIAHKNIDPYYQQILTSRAADVNANLANLKTQYETAQGQTLQDFGTQLATEQNAAAGSGTAFSGQRALNENNMAATTNRSLSALDANTALSAGNILRSGAADVGSSNANMFNLPTLAGASVSAAGGSRGSSSVGNALNFNYDPSIYGVGNIPSAQGAAAKNLKDTYLGQYGTLAGSQSNSGRSMTDLVGMVTQ